MDAIEPAKICNYKSYQDLDFNSMYTIEAQGMNPMILSASCEAIIASYEEAMIFVLQNRYEFMDPDTGEKILDDDKVITILTNKFCILEDSITRACFGLESNNTEPVDSSKKAKEQKQNKTEEKKVTEEDVVKSAQSLSSGGGDEL